MCSNNLDVYVSTAMSRYAYPAAFCFVVLIRCQRGPAFPSTVQAAASHRTTALLPAFSAAPAPHFAFVFGAAVSVVVDCKCIYSFFLYLHVSISVWLFRSLCIDDDDTAYLYHQGAKVRTAAGVALGLATL